MAHIITPNHNANKVNLRDISKRQLARAVNEQSQTIQKVEREKRIMVDLLLAITLAPEAFKYDGATPTIERSALRNVKHGTQLHLRANGDVIELSYTEPGEPVKIEIPHVIIPGGGTVNGS